MSYTRLKHEYRLLFVTQQQTLRQYRCNMLFTLDEVFIGLKKEREKTHCLECDNPKNLTRKDNHCTWCDTDW